MWSLRREKGQGRDGHGREASQAPDFTPEAPDGWQDCHHSLPRTRAPESSAAILPESRGDTVQGSEITLLPQDTTLLSFVSEQDSKEGDTQHPKAHCPEIHALLSLLGILRGDAGRSTFCPSEKQDGRGCRLQKRVPGLPLSA